MASLARALRSVPVLCLLLSSGLLLYGCSSDESRGGENAHEMDGGAGPTGSGGRSGGSGRSGSANHGGGAGAADGDAAGAGAEPSGEAGDGNGAATAGDGTGGATLGGGAGARGEAGDGTGATTGDAAGASGDRVSNGAVFDRGKDKVLVTQIVGPLGATLVGPVGSPLEGVTVTFPAGALATDTEISLGVNDGVLRDSAGDWSGLVVLLHSAGATVFAKQVEITIPAGDKTQYVAPYYIDEADHLHPAGVSNIDDVGHSVTLWTAHASLFSSTSVSPGKPAAGPVMPCGGVPSSFSTSFDPKRDGFKVANPGNADCYGMTSYALWYFENAPGGAKPLAQIPKVCQIRTANAAQLDAQATTEDTGLFVSAATSHYQLCKIADVMQDRQGPVMLHLCNRGLNSYHLACSSSEEGHSVLAVGYGPAQDCGGDLAVRVYDPNFPNQTRSICYDTAKDAWAGPFDGFDEIFVNGNGSSALSRNFKSACVQKYAGGWGDPHLYTWDRVLYDFQVVGEFDFVKLDGAPLIQVRTAPLGTSRRIAVIVAAAARVAGSNVVIHSGSPATMTIDGVAQTGALTLADGSTVSVNGVQWADGSALEVSPSANHLDVRVALPAGSATGLLGDGNDNWQDDLHLSGTSIASLPLNLTGMKALANAWRVGSVSLFDYASLQSTATFTDLTFPDATPTFDKATHDAARATCLAAGITDAGILSACIVDVATTGDSSYATSAAGIPAPACVAVPLLDWQWTVGPYSTTTTDPTDASSHAWYELDFNDSAYVATTLPASGIPAGADGFYRAEFELISPPENLALNFQSDDGLWLYVNGQFVGHWGGDWHGGGCVNGSGCGSSASIPPVPIAQYLVSGSNVVAVHVSNGPGGSTFNAGAACYRTAP